MDKSEKVRTRMKARNRALADLGKRYADEYRTLYREHLSALGLAGEARKIADEDSGVNRMSPESDPVEVLRTREPEAVARSPKPTSGGSTPPTGAHVHKRARIAGAAWVCECEAVSLDNGRTWRGGLHNAP